MKHKHNNNKGFTIIEVMVVLAIAGLILLIVFTSVPALRRSQRNDQRKRDAALVVISRENFDVNVNTPLTVFDETCSPGDTNVEGICDDVQTLSYYPSTAVRFLDTGTAMPTEVLTVDADHITSASHYKCDPATNTAVFSTNPREGVVIFALESGSGTPTPQCLTTDIF